MRTALSFISNAVGLLGVLLCVVSGMARVLGNPRLGGYESLTLFEIGVGLMVAACLAKLVSLELNSKLRAVD